MNIKDLVGLSKPITRLLDVLSAGVGRLYRSYFMRRDADAKAYEIKIITDALSQAHGGASVQTHYQDGKITSWTIPEDKTIDLQPPLDTNPIQSRLDFQHRKAQNNIECVTAATAEELSQENTTVPDEKPDEDWITRFFSHAGDINSKQMQELWGRLLAGEIKQPGSFSLRTLDAARNLTAFDADLFDQVAAFAVTTPSRDTAFIAGPDENKSSPTLWLCSTTRVSQGDLLHLAEIGLIHPPTELWHTFFSGSEPNNKTALLIDRTHALVIERHRLTPPISIPVIKLTKVGLELLPISQKSYNLDYVKSIARHFTSKHANVSLQKILAEGPRNEHGASLAMEPVSPQPSF